jgi:hypothetical protein
MGTPWAIGCTSFRHALINYRAKAASTHKKRAVGPSFSKQGNYFEEKKLVFAREKRL